MSQRPWRWWDGLPFALSWLYFLALAPYGLNLDDEGTLLYQIYRATVGQELYRDFHAGYTPGVYSWNALLWKVLGVNVLYLRWCLALVHASAVQLIYLLARLAGARAAPAAVAAASYVALIPFYDGNFLSANIPYPVWYVVPLWLLGVWALHRWWQSGQARWCFALGTLGGLVFWFKPNSGVLACGGFLAALASLTRYGEDPERREWLAGIVRLLRVVLPWGFVGGVAWIVAGAGNMREQAILVLPLLAYTLAVANLSGVLRRPASAAQLWAYGIGFAAGFLLITLPWAFHYWNLLGTRWFLRAVLFIGSDFERFYYIAYPALSRAGLAVGVVAVVAAFAVLLVRARLVAREVVFGSALLAFVIGSVWLWRHPPPMVEGWSASVTMRVREMAFTLALLTLWGAVGAWVLGQRRLMRAHAVGGSTTQSPSRLERQQALLVGLLFAALGMHVQLYPRADFMHLVPAAPGFLAAGGWLLSRLLDRGGAVLTRDRHWMRVLATVSLFPLALIVVSMAFPALRRAAYVALAEWRGDRSSVVRLGHPRAPLVIEPAAGRLFLSLRDTAQFLSQQTRPGEFVFTFPVLDILCLLSDRHNPTRHGYFYPGWPGHAVEAEVLDDLRTRPPRRVVIALEHPLFFAQAPVYFFLLRNWIRDAYVAERQLGMFEILRPAAESGGPYSVDEPEPIESLWKRELAARPGRPQRQLREILDRAGGADDLLAAELSRESEAVQSAFIQLVRKSRSREGAAVVALLLEEGTKGNKSEQLAVRTLAEIADSRAVPALLRAYDSRPELRGAIAGILFHIGNKSSFEVHWFSSDEVDRRNRLSLESRFLFDSIDSPFESLALRSFAIRAAGQLQDRSVIPILARLLGDRGEWRELASQAADSLAQMGSVRLFLPAVVELLWNDSVWAPSVLAEHWDPEDPTARSALERLLTQGHNQARELAFWVAAGVRDPALEPWFQVGLSDPNVQVRLASVWALGELGDKGAVPVLEEAQRTETNDEVQRFLRRALQKLGAG